MEQAAARGLVRTYATVIFIVSVLLLASGLLLLLAGSNGMMARATGPTTKFLTGAISFLSAYSRTAGIFLIVIATLYFITAVGLWGMRRWARTLGIVIAIISLFGFPLGTLVGVFGLVALVAGNDAFLERSARTHAIAGKRL